MDVGVLVEHVFGTETVGSAPVVPGELEGGSPEATRRDVIPGTPNQVAAVRNATNSTVLLGRTST